MSNMTRTDFIKNCWRFYLMLEKRFMETTQYVELSTDNFNTYSLEYVSLLQSVGSELDVFMKVVCGFNQNDRKTITDYYNGIILKYPNIKTQSVSVHLLNSPIKPFCGWSLKRPRKSLHWWNAYDSVKHGRIDNYKLASLENVLNALAALYLLEMYYLKDVAKNDEIDIPERESELFILDNWKTRYMTYNGYFLEVEDDTVSLALGNKKVDMNGGGA